MLSLGFSLCCAWRRVGEAEPSLTTVCGSGTYPLSPRPPACCATGRDFATHHVEWCVSVVVHVDPATSCRPQTPDPTTHRRPRRRGWQSAQWLAASGTSPEGEHGPQPGPERRAQAGHTASVARGAEPCRTPHPPARPSPQLARAWAAMAHAHGCAVLRTTMGSHRGPWSSRDLWCRRRTAKT